MGEVTLREIDQRFDSLKRQIADFEKHLTLQRESDLTALRLQAGEYERRLAALNHAHEKAVEVQHTYVTQDKYEDKLKSEQEARIHALSRIDEKFDDYVTRSDARVREIENALSAQATAAEVQGRASDDAARKAREAAEAAGRKSNRNIAIVGLVLTLIVIATQFIGSRETSRQIDEGPPVTTTQTTP